MWIKIGDNRINMDNVIKYNPGGYDTDIIFHTSSVTSVGDTCRQREANAYSLYVKKSAQKVCKYIDELIISGKYKDIGMIVIDSALEERISGVVEFKTLEEFNYVKD